MPLHTTDALILRTYQLSDADRIVVFLTRDRGKKRGVAKGARRMRSRFRGALEPLTWASVVYFEKESRELVSLNTADTLRSPLSAHHPDALTYVGYLAELIDEWAPEGDPNERLFRLGTAVVEALAGDAPVESLVRYFEYWLLRLQGVYPSVSACQRCQGSLSEGGRLAPAIRGFICRRCAPGAGAGAVSASAVRFLQSAATLAPATVGSVSLGPVAARELAGVHRALITWHLEKELRSTRVLREMR
jgi:DNA repair protein RecO (recombination protein O)